MFVISYFENDIIIIGIGVIMFIKYCFIFEIFGSKIFFVFRNL